MSPFPVPPPLKSVTNPNSIIKKSSNLEENSKLIFAQPKVGRSKFDYKKPKSKLSSNSEEPISPQAKSPDELIITTDLLRFASTLSLSINKKASTSNAPYSDIYPKFGNGNNPKFPQNMPPNYWSSNDIQNTNGATSNSSASKNLEDTTKLTTLLQQVLYSSWFPISKLKAEYGNKISLENITNELSKALLQLYMIQILILSFLY